jgi:hypothetical protein
VRACWVFERCFFSKSVARRILGPAAEPWSRANWDRTAQLHNKHVCRLHRALLSLCYALQVTCRGSLLLERAPLHS